VPATTVYKYGSSPRKKILFRSCSKRSSAARLTEGSGRNPSVQQFGSKPGEIVVNPAPRWWNGQWQAALVKMNGESIGEAQVACCELARNVAQKRSRPKLAPNHPGLISVLSQRARRAFQSGRPAIQVRLPRSQKRTPPCASAFALDLFLHRS